VYQKGHVVSIKISQKEIDAFQAWDNSHGKLEKCRGFLLLMLAYSASYA
jgi:hypothetical protein